MNILGTIPELRDAMSFGLLACFIAFLWAPLLIRLLYRYKITRRGTFDATLSIGDKSGVPIMGGLLIILTVACITYFLNWVREFTWMPIGIMLFASLLGGLDDVLNIFGNPRRTRKLSQVWRLIRVHNDWKQRTWLALTFPWSIFKRTALWLGSHPGKGLQVHERLLFQFLAGATAAWWVYFKLGEQWKDIYVPFHGFVSIGFWIIPLIILFIMFTANAVNVADGMDGLAGGTLIPTFSALMLLSCITGYQEMALLNATVVGALITYTYFNIKPARFQMGDVGSLGLGALLAINAIIINRMMLLPLFGFIFYIELLSVIVQILGRYILGRRIFKMAPLHHHFELRGWSEEKTVMRFWVIHGGAVLLGMLLALY